MLFVINYQNSYQFIGQILEYFAINFIPKLINTIKKTNKYPDY